MEHQTVESAGATEYLGELGDFFAPMPSDIVDSLIGQYQATRHKIETMARIVTDDGYEGAMGYFLEGNQPDASRHGGHQVKRLFDVEGALAALDADFWQRALNRTDVLEWMPADRRYEWSQQIHDHEVPRFEEDTVRATLETLLLQRGQFFGERVDGLFRALSGAHVTNRPEGFRRRMIVAGMIDEFGVVSRKSDYLNDLRKVIARFMGRDEPGHRTTYHALTMIKAHPGVWHTLDGGALRVKVFKIGTCHIEVHEDMAWRLNAVLASLYPSAIPSAFRTRPKRAQAKRHQLMDRPLPFAVINALSDFRFDGTTLHLHGFVTDKHIRQERERVIAAIGGVKQRDGSFAFDYCAEAVLKQVLLTGSLPDQRSHQYFPTPAHIAREAVERAAIGDDDTVLEPSAGQGHIACLLPSERTTCVEVSGLHCRVLQAKGLQVEQADFLEWAKTAPAFDRVVMNPPYEGRRWQLHLEAAAGLVRPGGRLSAIVPASAHWPQELSGWEVMESQTYEREFEGTCISVKIVTATRSTG